MQRLKINTTEIPSFQEYASEEKRLKSYEHWPQCFKLRPNVLAEAGFFYMGTEVKTICFQCGGGLAWDEHDDPFVEHARWFPECRYIKSHKQRKPASIEHLNFSLESDRLKSFENWPISFISKNELALAGFIYTQIEDRVRCYYCNVDLSNWKIGDDPFREHLKHSPNCSHSSFCKTMLENRSPRIQDFNNSSDSGYDTCGPYDILKRKSAAYPQYTSLENRINSFRNWSPSAKIRPSDLCEAGFFYTGIDDQTICYHCGGGLKDWKDQDEPWIEHAYWFPRCDFVLSRKGSAFIHETVRKPHEVRLLTQREIKAGVENSEDLLNTTNNSPDVNSESKDNANIEDASKMLCKICFLQDWNKLFYPCGHVACSKCANNIIKCAFCRKPILDRVEMYFS